MMRESSRTFRVVSFGSSLLISLTDHHCRIEVQGVVVELQLREEPMEQLSENTQVVLPLDSLEALLAKLIRIREAIQ